MTRQLTFKQCDMTRAIKAAQAAGLTVRGCEVDPRTGALRVLTDQAPAVEGPAPDPYDLWKHKRGQRAA